MRTITNIFGNYGRTNRGHLIRRWMVTVGFAASVLIALAASVRAHPAAKPDAKPDAEASRAAFLQVYRVLTSPRCKNCHPAGDAPLQGDDSHVHIQYVKRGSDGRGVYGMTCHTCHQDANLPGANMPPGNPKWSLPPAKMKMVIQGETAGQFCRQLKDPAKNGNRSLPQIMEHVSQDDLV